jgi:polysaccharide export outer membrane protein
LTALKEGEFTINSCGRGHMKIASRSFLSIGVFVLALSGTALGQANAGSDQPAHPAAPLPAAGQQPAAPEAKTSPEADYVIGNDDTLGINVWKEPELTESVPVRSDGKISLPLIGEIQASGRTPLQLKEDITAKLRAYLAAPAVTVTVLQMNSQKFNILGRVAKPGSYPLLATTTVLDAIAGAGGFQDFAKQKNIYILRRNPEGGETRISFNYKDVIRGNHPEENIKLKPNDTIVVP